MNQFCLSLAVDFMMFFKNNNQSAQHIDECDESKATNQAPVGNQLNSIEVEMGVVHTHTYDRNTGLTNRQSESSDAQKNDAGVIYSESNLTNDKYRVVGNLSSEVSAIYLAMQNSKLECVDEQSQDSISTEGRADPDEDEFDDFDPYTFIKDLPDLAAVVPKFRPVLLPKQTRRCPSTTLVLDLDGIMH